MANPRMERLQNDYQRLKTLVARSPFVRIVGVLGLPPTDYTVQFTCRGVASLNSSGQPTYAEDHRVRITLGPSYPLAKPGLQWLTPIFHPNIAGDGKVCIGSEWASGGRFLDDLIVYLAQMVRYEGAGLTYTRDAYNRAAIEWAERNRHLLPVDKRPLVHAELDIRIVSRPSLNIKVIRG